MIRFHDGPARAQCLALRRAPYLLRVTRAGSTFDALDLVDDVPHPDEQLFAYVLIEGPVSCHLKIAKPGRSGFYVMATYKLVPEQPADQDMRTRTRWAAWCGANAERLGWRKSP